MNRIVAALCLGLFVSNAAHAEEAPKRLPAVKIETLHQKKVDASTLSNDGKPMVLIVWSTWELVGKKLLANISEDYQDWQKDTGAKVIAVAIDDDRTMAKVEPLVEAKGWEFEVYLDPNSDLLRAFGGGPVPQAFVIDGKGVIRWHSTVVTPDAAPKIREELGRVATGGKPD